MTQTTEQLPPIPASIAAELERTDWTPAEALQFYADQRNFDIVRGHARIIDNGAIASNALKHLSLDRLELKGDAELTELRSRIAELDEENKRLLAANRDCLVHFNAMQEDLASAQLSNKQLRSALSDVNDLINASAGVTGLHLNGDVAPWEELREGGRFEEWLCRFDTAISAPIDTSALDSYVAEKVKEVEARTGSNVTCYQIARDMAVRMWERHYKDDAPNWEPLDDFMGVLSQISNMLTGLGNVEELTRQRDLAVEALKSCGINHGTNGPTQYFDEELVERAIKESEV